MELLVDLFGYFSIVIHGLTILAQSMAVGGAVFIVLLARPLAPRIGAFGRLITDSVIRMAGLSAAGLVASELLTVALQAAVLSDTVGIGVWGALTASFALAGAAKAVVAAVLAWLLLRRGVAAPCWALMALSVLILSTATLTTHAVARLDDRAVLFAATLLHQAGAAIWIGGLPSFLRAIYLAPDNQAAALIGARYSRISMLGVACILVSAVILAVHYIGDLQGFYGTAYGVMVSAKIALFLMLLGLGGMNFLLVRRAQGRPEASFNRLSRFAEVEVFIGVAVFFAAASLTSVPPAVDLSADRVTMAEIIDRNTPTVPRLVSPQHDTLALPALQQRLDDEAARRQQAAPMAFVPGAGDLPPRNAADIAWSEYNHHWAGLFVVAIGLLALLSQAGYRWARHWPLGFVGLAAFIFIRSDPESWPLGSIGFWEGLRDVEVLQHRAYVLLILAFAWFEWRVRQSDRPGKSALVFPLLCTLGGILLLTHTHAIANVREQLLIEITHTPLALAGIVAGCARWLELRLDPIAHPLAWRIAGWVWPVCLVLAGLILLVYREA